MPQTQNTYQAIYTLFHPRSIAVIGAPKELTKLGGHPIHNLLVQGFQGAIYPINPHHERIAGLKAFPSILDVPVDVDVALIVLPSPLVKQAIAECVRKGVKAAVVLSAGFAESGRDGEQLQKEILELANRHGMRLVGPNCVGIANLLNGASISFILTLSEPNPVIGEIAFVSQSGAVGFNILDFAQEDGVGFNYWATTGNEADLGFLDFVSYVLERPDVKAVGGYIESLKDGDGFRRVARRARELNKLFVCMKVGTSEAGKQAVTSHTGSLAGADTVYEAVFRQEHVIRVKNKDEMLDTLMLAVSGKRPKGRRIGAVTSSGGNGIMIADYAAECGLEVPEASRETQDKLMKIIPPYGSARNPIDITAQMMNDGKLLNQCLALALAEERFDIVVLTVTNFHERFIDEIKRLSDSTDKLVCLAGTSRIHKSMQKRLRELDIPFFLDFFRCIKAIANLVRFVGYSDESDDCIQIHDSPDSGKEAAVQLPQDQNVLAEAEIKSLLSKIIAVPEGGTAATADEAVQLAERIGYPVVLKVHSSEIAHKTDAGGVKLNLKNDQEVEKAFCEVMNNVRIHAPYAKAKSVLIERCVNEIGMEVVIGFHRDPVFGHSLTFGLGGIFVEVIRDTSSRVLPVNRSEVRRMIREIKGWPLLEGFRGDPGYDVEELERAVVTLAKFVENHADRIDELEINPLKVFRNGKGVCVLDALLTLRS